jgi:integrase
MITFAQQTADAVRLPPVLISRHVAADALVLAGVPLRAGTTATSRFSDDVWDIGPALHADNEATTRIHFRDISDPLMRLTAKELLYARMHCDVAGYKRIKPASLRGLITAIRSVLSHFRKIGLTRFDEVTPEILAEYVHEIVGNRRSFSFKRGQMWVFRLMYDFRCWLTYDAMKFLPWPGRSPSKIVGGPRETENLTPRVPEDVMGPLVYWALRYVRDFSPTIFAAIERFNSTEPVVEVDPSWSPAKRIQRYLDHLRSEGRGLPDLSPGNPQYFRRRAKQLTGRADYLNWHQIGKEAGAPHTFALVKPEHEQQVLAGFRELGFDWECTARKNPDALEALLGHGIFGMQVRTQARHLITAAYIITAYLSGMRDSEVQSLRPGCVRRVRSADGTVERWKVRGKVYKARAHQGDETEWVIIEPVAQALEAVERLHVLYGLRDGLPLFTRLDGTRKSDRAAGLRVAVNDNINGFADMVRMLGERTQARDSIPVSTFLPPVEGPGGESWRFRTRQFRRTLAWYIANRPFGTVAGLLQYKHVSVQLFEGYAGRSASGFRLEVEQERALAAMDSLYDRYEDWISGVAVTGPGAPKLQAEFERVRDTCGDLPGRIADEGRVRSMLKLLSKNLHVGALADCQYNRDTALCRKNAVKAPGDGPLLSMCQPSMCPNAIIGKEHVPRWQRVADEIDTRLARRRELPVLQVKVLEMEKERITTVLAGGARSRVVAEA